MNKRTHKKGFTIVELVIVIAVIAILAAVLIPTFAGLVKKANLSADTQTAKTLNTALAAAEAEEEVDSFSDALAAMREAGYIVGNLNPTAAGNYFVWESDSNQILLVDEDMAIIYQTKDLKVGCDTIAGGTWYIALNDPALLEGVEGAQVIPSMTDKAIDGKGDNVKNLLKDGGTVTLSEPVTVTTAPSGANGISDGIRIAADKETTLDLNGQTLTAEFTTTDHRAFQVNGGADFTLANGAIVASGKAQSGGMYGVLHAWKSADVAVKNMDITYTNTLSDAAGSVIFVRENSNVVVEDTVIRAGNTVGIEVASGSTGVLKNVTIKGVGEGWASTAVGVSYGANVTIESGYYEAQDKALYVFSSGGTINVKGGTFVGGLAVDNESGATADSKIVISGGTFNGKPYTSYTKSDWENMVVGEDSVTINNGVVTILLPKA